jgi:hypothetical protein
MQPFTIRAATIISPAGVWSRKSRREPARCGEFPPFAYWEINTGKTSNKIRAGAQRPVDKPLRECNIAAFG